MEGYLSPSPRVVFLGIHRLVRLTGLGRSNLGCPYGGTRRACGCPSQRSLKVTLRLLGFRGASARGAYRCWWWERLSPCT